MTFQTAFPILFNFGDWDVDTRNRGGFADTGESQFGVRGSTRHMHFSAVSFYASSFENDNASSATGNLQGVYWQMFGSGALDLTANERVLGCTLQWDGPERIQLATVDNAGFVFRIASGSATPPTEYRQWNLIGRDTLAAFSSGDPWAVVVDLNSTPDYETASFDETDVQCIGFGSVRYDMVGTATTKFAPSWVFLMNSEKGNDLPVFRNAAETWQGLIARAGPTFQTKQLHDIISWEGTDTFQCMCPLKFGNGTQFTSFDDQGATVFWPDTDKPDDPRIRARTGLSFRVYAGMRNLASDWIRMSGTYYGGNTLPDWDFSQSNDAPIEFTDPTFNDLGDFLVGSSVVGPATWSHCGEVTIVDNGADIDGSTFRNGHKDALLVLVP